MNTLFNFNLPSWAKFKLPRWSYYLLATALYVVLIPVLAIVSYAGFMQGITEQLKSDS